MGIGATVEFLGVEVVGESDLALCCRVAGQDHWIAREQLLSGSSVGYFSDRGSLVLARQFAEDRGLLRGQASRAAVDEGAAALPWGMKDIRATQPQGARP